MNFATLKSGDQRSGCEQAAHQLDTAGHDNRRGIGHCAFMSIGRGVERQITAELQSAGTNVLFIFSGRPGGSASEDPVHPLTYEDALELEELTWDGTVVGVATEGSGRSLSVVAQGGDTRVTVTGVTANYLDRCAILLWRLDRCSLLRTWIRGLL